MENQHTASARVLNAPLQPYARPYATTCTPGRACPYSARHVGLDGVRTLM